MIKKLLDIGGHFDMVALVVSVILLMAVSYGLGTITVKTRTVTKVKTKIKYVDRIVPKTVDHVKTVPVEHRIYVPRTDTIRTTIWTVKEVEKPVFVTRENPVAVNNTFFGRPTVVFTGFRPDSMRWEEKVYAVPLRKRELYITAHSGVLGDDITGSISMSGRIGRIRVSGGVVYFRRGLYPAASVGIDLFRR